MRPSPHLERQLPPLKEVLEPRPLYGIYTAPRDCLGSRYRQLDCLIPSWAHKPMSPPLDTSSGFDTDTSIPAAPPSTRIVKLDGSIDHSTPLSVPVAAEKSAGGWFDPSRWLFKLVFQKVGDKSIEELIRLMFQREARPRYGEDHTSTRSRKPADQLRLANPDMILSSKQNSSDAHKQQEQDRRWRHRKLQYETDECTGTYVCETAEEMLPLIKETINQMPREEHIPQEPDRKVKRLGKDEQLTAAALLPHISSILIFKLYDALEKLKASIRQKDYDLQYEKKLREGVEDDLYRLRHENELLMQRLSSTNNECHTASRKRPAATLEEEHNYEREAKCSRLSSMWPPTLPVPGCHLPLSPRSDGDELTTSFSTSFSSSQA